MIDINHTDIFLIPNFPIVIPTDKSKNPSSIRISFVLFLKARLQCCGMDSSIEDQTRNSTTPASPWTCRISRSVQPVNRPKWLGGETSRRATQVSDLTASCPEESRTSSLSVQGSSFKETLSVPLNRSWPTFRANT